MAKDLTGIKFGKWKVISFYEIKHNHRYWNCICECGKEKTISGGDLKRGRSTSCSSCSKQTHGLTLHPLYDTVNSAINRCNNPKNPKYKNYGAKGIKFKFNSISDAIKWIEENLGSRPEGMELDRIDTNGNYEPDINQLRWATARTQANNRSKKSFTGYSGVSANGKNFMARIFYNGKPNYIGTFPTAKLASLAYESCKVVLDTAR